MKQGGGTEEVYQESPKKKTNAWMKKGPAVLDQMLKFSQEPLNEENAESPENKGREDSLDGVYFGKLPEQISTNPNVMLEQMPFEPN